MVNFWRNRGKLGKTLIVTGAAFVAIIIVGIAVPAPDDGEEASPATTESAISPAGTTTETTTETTTTPADEAAAEGAWTEFGAKETVWNASHEPDTRYAEGCCFLPGPKSGGGRYAALSTEDFNGVSRVNSFDLFFEPAIPLDLAKVVVEGEAPPDARLAYSIKKSVCLLLGYKSAALGRAFWPGAGMSAGLYSSPDGPFNGRTVTWIIFLPLLDRSMDC